MPKRQRAGRAVEPVEEQAANEHSEMDVSADMDELEANLADKAEQLLELTAEPEVFFQPDAQRADSFTGLLKWLFDYAKNCELDGGAFRKPLGPLDELHVQGFDVDSIWEEMQLRNGPLVKHLKRLSATLTASQDISLANLDDLHAQEASGDAGDDSDSDDDEQQDDSSDVEEDALEAALDAAGAADGNDSYDEHLDLDDELDSDDDAKASKGTKRGSSKSSKAGAARSGRSNRVGFFDWNEMDRVGDEGILEDDPELGDDILDEMYGAGSTNKAGTTEGDTATFADFFTEDDYTEFDGEWGGPEEQLDDGSENDSDDAEAAMGAEERGFFDDDDADDDSGSESEEDAERGNRGARSHAMDVDDAGSGADSAAEEQPAATAYGRAKQKMQTKISELEQELLRERPWALRGEVTAKDRPENSLLEAALDVERATRVAPAITVEKTASLEDVIKQRILADKFDDVAPKNIELPAKKADLPEVSMDKSTEGLAEVYEKEYMRRTLGVEEDDPQKDAKEEMRALFTKLCGKLDALCNFHFTPKPSVPDIAVQADVPAIAMEEALPAGVSNADALAPEEVYRKKRGREAAFLEEGEMDQSDRHRARLAKKRVRNQKRRQGEAEEKLVARANPGLGNPYEKKKMLQDIRSAKNVTEADETLGGKEFSTSTKFFGALQQQVKASIQEQAGDASGSSKAEKRSNKAAALRL